MIYIGLNEDSYGLYLLLMKLKAMLWSLSSNRISFGLDLLMVSFLYSFSFSLVFSSEFWLWDSILFFQWQRENQPYVPIKKNPELFWFIIDLKAVLSHWF